MGDKYILELEDKPLCVFDEDTQTYFPRLHRVKGFNSLVFDQNGLDRLTPYTEPDMEQVRKEAYEDGYKTAKVQCNIQAEKDLREVGERHYQKGLSDAWDAARRIVCRLSNGGYTQSVLYGIFGSNEHQSIMAQYSASDAVKKIRQYEQEKEEIKVGDEVKSIESGWTAIVTKSEEGHLTLMGDSGAIANGYDAKYFAKTGRHFHEIAAVLEKMREDAT